MNRHRFVPVEWIRLKFTAKPWSPDFIKVFILPESSLTLTVPAEVITCSGHGHPDMQPDLMQPQGSFKDTEKLSRDRKNR